MSEHPRSARELLTNYGLSEGVINGVLDIHAHELAERQRHDHNLGGGCNLGVCHGDSLPDLIDPEVDYDGENVQPVRPGEETTT